MRHIPALLAIAILVAACSPAPPKDTASESPASENSRSSIAIPAVSSAVVSSSPISSNEATCLSEIGKAASDRLVQRCIMVSPATHPPCNAANTCQMIQDEIDRSCAMYGPGETKPKECTA